MGDNEAAVEKIVLTQLMRLNALILGLITGITLGGIVFAATLLLVIKGGPNVGIHLILLNNFFPGYTVTAAGSIIGLFYGFIAGFVTGSLVGFLYNWFAQLRNMSTTHRKD